MTRPGFNPGAYGLNAEERDKEAVLEIIRNDIAKTDPTEKPLPWCIFLAGTLS